MNNKVNVVYWSGTGNTEAMARLIAAGAAKAGGSARLITADSFCAADVASAEVLALGCPAMGSEQLEDCEFQPMYDSVRSELSGKKLCLFGSYGWGDGQWMQDWQEDASAAGAVLVAEPVIVCGAPEGEDADSCTALGAAAASA